MKIKVLIYLDHAEVYSFEGLAADCPPIPAIGQEVVFKGTHASVEGVQHTYDTDGKSLLIEVFA